MFCPMEPPIGASVIKLNEQRFRVGSQMVVEESNAQFGPPDVLARWQDNGVTFILRRQNDFDHNMAPSSSAANKVQEAGTCEAAWLFGKDTYCKVFAWVEGTEKESDVIAFVRSNCPHIPVAEVIFSWIDHDWNRSFTLLRRVPGKTLDESWPSLSQSQRSDIAQTVAQYCVDLAKLTSPKFESATHKGVLEEHFNGDAADSHPSWRPRPLGPLTRNEFTKFLKNKKGKEVDSLPEVGPAFHFYHHELGPTCIMVSAEGKVTGILNWRDSGFFPRFWISLKPVINAGFLLDPDYSGPTREERAVWAFLFQKALIAAGFEYSEDALLWYKGTRSRP